MLRPFELHQPSDVTAASALVGRYGDAATFYAGGTELLLIMKEGLAAYRHLVDLKTIPGLGEIGYDDASGWLSIGGTATHYALERHLVIRRHAPIIGEVERHVANIRVRSAGTIGGNLCFAEPHADPGTLFLTMDAEIDLASAEGARTVPIDRFFTGAFDTARRPDEVLTRVRVRPWGPQTRGVYTKFGIHERPTLGVALALTLDTDRAVVRGVRLAVGCVGPSPVRIAEAEGRLQDAAMSEIGPHLDAAAQIAGDAVDAVDDLHGSAEYKREMVKVFVRRAFHTAAARFV